MAIKSSPPSALHLRGNGSVFSVKSVDFRQLGDVSPLAVVDDFRISRHIFSPHPHAGFSAVTYVFEDSKGDLRNRDSLGNDLVVGPGGIVWTQAGNGVIHEELPAVSGQELHGLQFFVNLSSAHKANPPRVWSLQGHEVPVWTDDDGQRVRVVVGKFRDVASPLIPDEPFTLLDAHVLDRISFHLPIAHNALIYVLDGSAIVRAEGYEQKAEGGHALALHGNGTTITVATVKRAHLLIMSGAEIREPMVMHGSFIMNDYTQVQDAMVRYQSGKMGILKSVQG